ncbi:hypothetical protein HPB49_016105 [Dermacentor silvarum]|uniref:Uncharacterized protein n=1 Tax=Dermacentor silvarum TaxID=543639 RepID=A0ACB8CG24_DERSI|nr:hypothetical protein HPB49_016105 [Dermacentor silvarum]
MDAVGRAEGCSTCGIGTFKNRQEQFQHSFSLEHHTRVDEQSQSLAKEEASRAKPKPSLKQSERAKGVSKANKKKPLSKAKQVKKVTAKQYRGSKKPTNRAAVGKKSTKQVLKNCDRKTRYGNQGHQRSNDTNSQDYKDNQKEPSRRGSWPSDGSGAKPSKRPSVQRDSSEPTPCLRSRDDTRNPSSKDSSFEGDSSLVEEPGDDGDYEMNRNWNGPPRFPMNPYGRGAFMGYGGRGNPPWNRPPPPRHPFNRYEGPRQFNRYSRHPPAESPSPWSSDDYGCGFGSYGNGGWQGGNKSWNRDAHENDTRHDNDSAGRHGGHRSHHHSPENTSKTDSHSEHAATGASKEQGEKPASCNNSSSSASSSSKSHGQGSNGKPSVSAKSSTPASTRSRSSTPASTSEHSSSKVSSLPAKLSKSAAGGTATAASAEEPPARRGEGGAKSDLLSRQSQKKDVQMQEPSKPVSKIVKKPSLQTPAIKFTSKKAVATSSPRPSPRSKSADGSKALASPMRTGATSSSAPPSMVVGKPRPTTRSGTSPSPAATEMKIKVKQEASKDMGSSTENTVAASSSSSNRNHLIFLSSEEEDADAPGETATLKKKARPDGDTTTTEKTVPRPKHCNPAAAAMPPPSPDRGEPQVKKVVLKSPKLGPLSTKDMYRRDVLDKLVNFPSSPQVQAQLNKWMMEMQKSQRSVTSRKTMRLCATQARLGQEDDALLGSIPNIDFDVLLRQVESCELPEEMLKSLMQALNTDAEQPHSTAGEAPSLIAASLGSKGSSLHLTSELRASPRSTPPMGGAAAKSVAIKTSPASAKISSAAESLGSKSASEDECMVVPTPKKNVVPVLIDSDDNGSTDDEDNKPSTTTPTVKALGGKTTPEHCAQSSSPLAQEGGHRVRKIQKLARRKGRQPSESMDGSLTDSAAASSRPVESSSNARAVELSQESKRLSPRLKSTTPTTAAGSTAMVTSSVASSSRGRCSAQMSVSPPTFPEVICFAKLHQISTEFRQQGTRRCQTVPSSPPPPSVAIVAKVEPPPTPPPPAALPEDAVPLDAMPPGALPPGAMPSGITPALPVAVKSLVGDLTLRCQQEDAIRQELARIEQGIVSALATLEQLKKRKEELLGREAQVRKERLEILQCLQGAASALPGDSPPLLHFTLPAQSPTAVEMLSSFGTSGTDAMFGTSQAPPGGAPPVIMGQDQDREKGPQQSKKVKTSLLLTQSQGFALATKVPHTGRTPCQVEESEAQEGRGRAAPWYSQQHSRSAGLEQPGTREAWLPFWRSSHHRSHWAPRIAQEQQAGITGSQVSSGSRSDPPRPGVSA